MPSIKSPNTKPRNDIKKRGKRGVESPDQSEILFKKSLEYTQLIRLNSAFSDLRWYF